MCPPQFTRGGGAPHDDGVRMVVFLSHRRVGKTLFFVVLLLTLDFLLARGAACYLCFVSIGTFSIFFDKPARFFVDLVVVLTLARRQKSSPWSQDRLQ